jgi:proteasome lid subunit RPN8/RPN11
MSWQELKQEMVAHARQHENQEVCGIIAGGKYWPCENLHSSPSEHFAISAEDYTRIEPFGIEAIFHSHLYFSEDKFSRHDIMSCKQINEPWVMYCLPANSWHFMDPTGNAPYLERPWIYGIYDCYGLVRDYYRREFSIQLDDYERGAEFEWKSNEWRMFEKNFKGQGFIEIGDSDIRKGDVLLMQLQADSPNHVGVIHSPSENIFYQHLLDRLSEANIYGGYWQKNTVKILRHQELFQ